MALTIDFGFDNTSASWNEAYLALLFACKGDPGDIGRAPGPLAVADASRFVELFEMQVGTSPLEVGTYSEVVGGDNPIERAVARAEEARSRGMFPIIVGEDRRVTEAYCRDPLVALWGKVGRIEADEQSLFSKVPSVLVGVRSATNQAFQTIPPQVTILTARAVSEQADILPQALGRIGDPVHLSIDLDALAPAVAQTPRSMEPGGLTWYALMDAIQAVFEGPGLASAELVGTATIGPRSPAALLASQILLKMAGLLSAGLGG